MILWPCLYLYITQTHMNTVAIHLVYNNARSVHYAYTKISHSTARVIMRRCSYWYDRSTEGSVLLFVCILVAWYKYMLFKIHVIALWYRSPFSALFTAQLCSKTDSNISSSTRVNMSSDILLMLVTVLIIITTQA